MHRGLFQWDVGEGLSEKEVFEHRSERREEKNQARSWGDAFLADSRKGCIHGKVQRLVWLEEMNKGVSGGS